MKKEKNDKYFLLAEEDNSDDVLWIEAINEKIIENTCTNITVHLFDSTIEYDKRMGFKEANRKELKSIYQMRWSRLKKHNLKCRK